MTGRVVARNLLALLLDRTRSLSALSRRRGDGGFAYVHPHRLCARARLPKTPRCISACMRRYIKRRACSLRVGTTDAILVPAPVANLKMCTGAKAHATTTTPGLRTASRHSACTDRRQLAAAGLHCLECQPGRAGNSAVTMRLNHQTFNALLAVLRAHRRVSAR